MRNPLLKVLKDMARALGGHGLGRIKPLRWCYDRLYQALRPTWVMVQGHRMFLDEMDTLELATREVYEPFETRLLTSRLKPGETFLDLGANIGYYTLLAARQVGPQGRVFAFEPDPDNFRLLKKNVEANGYVNVTLVQRAVADRTGKTRLYLNPLNRGDHRLYDSRDGRLSIEVDQVSLDEFFASVETPVHFIKMDVQGAEARALKGMRGLLQRPAPLTLVSEFEPEGLRRFGSDPGAYLLDLAGLGFRIREIDEEKGHLLDGTPEGWLARFPRGQAGYTNLFCEKD